MTESKRDSVGLAPTPTVTERDRYDHGPRVTWKCQKCAETVINATAIYMRTTGWRIWEGTTEGGSVVSVVACPACAVGANVNDEGELEGFDATCNTCGENATDENWDDPLTEDDAKRWMRDHECEPSVEIIRPKPKVVDHTYRDAAPAVHTVSAKAAYL